ncbi:MAG TPA: carboxypeptidase-like regulatory domain-containing protein [Candidatus Binatia bacterium]|nr:carboxypeptidase-like regulatory domain-containing protein [Candidatus Binatia bacterium]
MKNRNWGLALPLLLLCLAALLYGQAATGKIFGTIKDPEGAYLPGVTVTATNISTNAVTTTVTEKKGTFRFLALDPGPYQISFDLEGYQSLVQAGIQMYTDQTVRLRIKLKKKAASES